MKEHKPIVFLDGEAQLPENAEFLGVVPFTVEQGHPEANKMEINRTVEPCTCCGDVIKLMEWTSKILM